MSVRLMRMAQGLVYSARVDAATYSHVAVSPTNATAGVRLHLDGTLDSLSNITYTDRYTWKTGVGTSANYEGKWQSTVGSLSSGTENTWQALDTSRVYYVQRVSDAEGLVSCTGTLSIRSAITQVVLASAEITLYAEVVL